MKRKEFKESDQTASPFEQTYPHIAEWVLTHGWIEVGQLEGTSAFAMALDEGGTVWEGKRNYKTMDEAFQELEDGIAKWMKEEWGEE